MFVHLQAAFTLCSCLWSLPLKPIKSHIFPLAPLGHPAVDFKPFLDVHPTMSPEPLDAVTLLRLPGASSSCSLVQHPNHGWAVVCWGPWSTSTRCCGVFLCLVLCSAHLQAFMLVVISSSSRQLTVPTTVNVGGSQKSNPWIYIIVSRSEVWSSETVWLLSVLSSFYRLGLFQPLQFLL